MTTILETLQKHAGPQRATLALATMLLPTILERSEDEQREIAGFLTRTIKSPKLRTLRDEVIAQLPESHALARGERAARKEAPQGGRWIEEALAIDRYEIRSRSPISNFGYPHVLLHEGDLDLGGLALDAWFEDAHHENAPSRPGPSLVIVDGFLRSSSMLRLPDDPRVCLLVTGNLDVPCLELGEHQAMLVLGDATIHGGVVATKASGELHVVGRASAPYVFDNGDNVVSAGEATWTSVCYRQPRDLEVLCDELGIRDVDFADPDAQPEMRIVEELLTRDPTRPK